MRMEADVKKTALVIAGSSGAGKTTTVRLLREVTRINPQLSSTIAFPCRYTTRGGRNQEDYEESKVVGRSTFQSLLEFGHIDVAWERPMPGAWAEPELYGFAKHQRPIAILSANNALLRSPSVIAKVYEEVLTVVIEAPADLRLKRLQTRSPEMPEAEMRHRVLDEGLDIRKYADIVISTLDENFMMTASKVLNQIAKLIDHH